MVLCPHIGIGLQAHWALRRHPHYCLHSCVSGHSKPLRRRRTLITFRRLCWAVPLVALVGSYPWRLWCPKHLRLALQGICRNLWSKTTALPRKVVSPDGNRVAPTAEICLRRNNLIPCGVAIDSLLRINLKKVVCAINRGRICAHLSAMANRT